MSSQDPLLRVSDDVLLRTPTVTEAELCCGFLFLSSSRMESDPHYFVDEYYACTGEVTVDLGSLWCGMPYVAKSRCWNLKNLHLQHAREEPKQLLGVQVAFPDSEFRSNGVRFSLLTASVSRTQAHSTCPSCDARSNGLLSNPLPGYDEWLLDLSELSLRTIFARPFSDTRNIWA